MASLSELPVTIRLPSGEKHKLLIASEWYFKGFPILTPVSAFQIMASES